MCDKAKGFFKGKFKRLKELIVNNKVIVAILALFLIAFAVLIIVTATMPDANRLNYTEKADGTLEVAEIKNSYKDGWFCKDSLIVPEQVNGKKVTSVARLDSAKLQKIILPDSVTEIKSKAFSDCSSLSEIALGNHLEIIGDGAWTRCTSLHEVRIPQSVIAIGELAFWGCSGLTSITIPDSVASIGGSAFEGTAYYNNDSNWTGDVLYIGNYLIETRDTISGSYSVRSGTKTIADYAFKSCVGLTSIDIPDSVTSIGNSTFSVCSGLTSVTIGEGVTSIGTEVFSGCSGLTSVIIPSSVNSIGERAFSGCSDLKEVHFENQNGWKVSEYSVMSSAKAVLGLDGPATAAQYLTNTYCSYYWKREG